MWPWEHIAVGYIVFSLGIRILQRRLPRNSECFAVVLGSLFPDLIDKPLGWLFQVLTGVSLAHSVFFAVPFSLTAVWIAHRFGAAAAGTAFTTGYLFHLLGDALFNTISKGQEPAYRVFLWPVAPMETNPPGNFLYSVQYYFENYRALLADPNNVLFLVFELTLLMTALSLWVADGRPGLVFGSRMSVT